MPELDESQNDHQRDVIEVGPIGPAMRQRIEMLLAGVVSDITGITVEATYRGEGKERRLVEHCIILRVKCG